MRLSLIDKRMHIFEVNQALHPIVVIGRDKSTYHAKRSYILLLIIFSCVPKHEFPYLFVVGIKGPFFLFLSHLLPLALLLFPFVFAIYCHLPK